MPDLRGFAKVVSDGFQFPDGPPHRGISHLAALALVVMELETVRRSTIAELCASVAVERHGATVTPRDQVRRAFRNFEQSGWGRRDGKFFHVDDFEALFEWVRSAVDVNPDRAMSLLNVAHAARAIAEAPIATMAPDEIEARERELQALDRLMRRAPGVPTNERGTRRLIHCPGSLIEVPRG